MQHCRAHICCVHGLVIQLRNRSTLKELIKKRLKAQHQIKILYCLIFEPFLNTPDTPLPFNSSVQIKSNNLF